MHIGIGTIILVILLGWLLARENVHEENKPIWLDHPVQRPAPKLPNHYKDVLDKSTLWFMETTLESIDDYYAKLNFINLVCKPMYEDYIKNPPEKKNPLDTNPSDLYARMAQLKTG